MTHVKTAISLFAFGTFMQACAPNVTNLNAPKPTNQNEQGNSDDSIDDDASEADDADAGTDYGADGILYIGNGSSKDFCYEYLSPCGADPETDYADAQIYVMPGQYMYFYGLPDGCYFVYAAECNNTGTYWATNTSVTDAYGAVNFID